MEIMSIFFHLADISNSAKPFAIYREWTDRLFVEFFAQGDLERESKQQITMLMDRNTTNIAKSQLGFIDFVITPIYNACVLYLPKLERELQVL